MTTNDKPMAYNTNLEHGEKEHRTQRSELKYT